jgi:plastocyanin
MSVAVLALVAIGCSKKEKEESSEPAAAEPVKAAPAAAEKAAEPAGFGTVSGTVAFTGKAPEAAELPRKSDPVCAAKPMKSNEVIVNANATLKDVMVRIAPGTVKGKFAAPADMVQVKQQDCMYSPRLQGAVSGQVVQVENDDKTMHNVHTYRGQETILNQGQPAGSPAIKCDVHPWMEGYLVVTDHPFFQATGADGAFKLDKVPAGKYTIEAWHSKYGLKTAQVTVEPNKVAEAKFSFDGTEKAQ